MNLHDPGSLILSPSPAGLHITTASIEADIEGEGVWSKTVEANLWVVRYLIFQPDDEDPTVWLTYAAGSLTVDRTIIDAREVLVSSGGALRRRVLHRQLSVAGRGAGIYFLG